MVKEMLISVGFDTSIFLLDRQQTQSNQSNKLFLQYTSQGEAYSGYYSKPGKTKGERSSISVGNLNPMESVQ